MAVAENGKSQNNGCQYKGTLIGMIRCLYYRNLDAPIDDSTKSYHSPHLANTTPIWKSNIALGNHPNHGGR